MTIEKKVWPEYFEKLLSGGKTFELRLADWKCSVGDTLILKEFDPTTKKYTGRELKRVVTYVILTKDVENSGMFPKEDIEKFGFQIIALK
jgi:hypothetical protein